jgi:hypothetical protein
MPSLESARRRPIRRLQEWLAFAMVTWRPGVSDPP